MIQLFKSITAATKARNKEWTSPASIPLSFWGVELAGECGEACNVIKKLERERLGMAGSRDTKEHLAEELSDVVICAYLAAEAAGIDLEKEIPKKFNMTSHKLGFWTRMEEL